ncbi:SoxR reducing system RseC family protein [Dichelobacter nodosus]|uniref:SoxR reducing system RseC family protein n=1 Tax=Dichelobacter nodosus TaxID=870 RepID=UPI00107EE119|nr:SoxR reducing system RseC family protein [Dichelobacter nodosus]TGA65432.1 hypothetical protein E5E99_03145 [Dichelobacter nodosus]
MNDFLKIPVKIIAQNEHYLTINMLGENAQCLHCTQNCACGKQEMWFTGAIFPASLTLPRQPETSWGDYGMLCISRRILSLLAIYTYGLPLFLFFVVLFMGTPFAEYVTFFAAILSGAGAVLLSKNHRQCLLQRHLSLYPAENAQSGFFPCSLKP